MLVLSRKKEEKIIIGNDIELMIIDVKGNKVILGVNAPKGVTIHREEVHLKIQKQTNQ